MYESYKQNKTSFGLRLSNHDPALSCYDGPPGLDAAIPTGLGVDSPLHGWHGCLQEALLASASCAEEIDPPQVLRLSLEAQDWDASHCS